MRNRANQRLIETMRNLMAQGWTSEAMIVDTAAEIFGGDEAAKMQAQRVWDQHFGVMPSV